jgi:hexulose-6-phosphate isomerase
LTAGPAAAALDAALPSYGWGEFLMQNAIQINYWTIGGFEGAKPIAQAMAEAKDMGCDGLELTFGAGCLAPGISDAACREIRTAARRLGLRLETVASGGFWSHSLSDPRPAVRRQAIAFTREYLRVARGLGAKVALVIPGAVAVPWDAGQPVVPYRTVWRNATASLRELLPVARQMKIKLGLENVWNCFLTDPMAMRMFVDQFHSRQIGVYFDAGNCLINGYPEHWIEILGRRIVAVHVKNFSRQDCGGGLHGFGDDLLQGDLDWPALFAALERSKYRGPITAEMIPFSRLPELGLPDVALARKTIGQLCKLLKRR